jgi:hypothetical protein
MVMALPSFGQFLSRAILAQIVAIVCMACPACDAATILVAQKRAPQTVPAQPESPGSPGESPVPPDKDGEFFECRSLPDLGQITFTDNAVRGAKRVQYLKEHASALAEKGIYACADEAKRHVYRTSEKVGDRTIESAVIIDPPTNEGDNGDYFTGRLIVKVDGRRKIDCTIGTTADGELWVNKVTIHVEDGTVEIHALSGDGNEMNIPEAQESLDDPRVITDQSFYDDEPETGGGAVKV